MENTRLKYVHVNSHHRINEDNKSKFTVHLGGHPIKNVKRVGVKQFTMANTIFNINDHNNKFYWAEYWRPSFGSAITAKVFHITIPTGYYSTPDLLITMNNLILSLANHSVVSESALSIVLSQNSITYRVSIALTQDSGTKWFAPITSQRYQTWELLGFTREQTLWENDFQNFSEMEAILLTLGGRTDSQTVAPLVNAKVANATLVSHHSATFENPRGIYLCSETLTNGNTYESRRNQITRHLEATPSQILEWIQFDVPRYSYIQYKSETIHWHYLGEKTINQFDIQLKSADGLLYAFDDINVFDIVLVFETIEHDEVSKNYIKAYNQEGYALAHKPDNVRI